MEGEGPNPDSPVGWGYRLISSKTPGATGQRWEIKCALEEEKPLLGLWIEDDYRTKPSEMGIAPCKVWTWPNVAGFIDDL